MNHSQQKKLGNAYDDYAGAGGTMDVDGVPQPTGNLAGLVAALSCLDDAQVSSLMSDMATLQMMAEENAIGLQQKPGVMPSKASKPRLHVSCKDQSWNATWS